MALSTFISSRAQALRTLQAYDVEQDASCGLVIKPKGWEAVFARLRPTEGTSAHDTLPFVKAVEYLAAGRKRAHKKKGRR